MNFKRFRQRRVDEETRRKYRETSLKPADFIWPVFLKQGARVKEEIPSMPGVCRYSVDEFLNDLSPLKDQGLKSVLLFGVPETKGIEQAYSETGIVQTAIPVLRREFQDLEIITDVCLCSYTEDGHCHIGKNDETCEILARIALSHAKAGADWVAPSDMMDGRVHFIKRMLESQGFSETKILSYAAKFASSYYGPFRDAADCAPKTGDRKTYQMDPANGREALLEIEADIEEGADAVMIKPALAYLDIVARARDQFKVPIVAYNVSGEYSMLKLAVLKGLMQKQAVFESLLSIKRAGAGRIISYFVPEILGELS